METINIIILVQLFILFIWIILMYPTTKFAKYMTKVFKSYGKALYIPYGLQIISMFIVWVCSILYF